MKDIERQIDEIEKGMAAEDRDTNNEHRISPLISSLVFWATTIVVAGLVVYSSIG